MQGSMGLSTLGLGAAWVVLVDQCYDRPLIELSLTSVHNEACTVVCRCEVARCLLMTVVVALARDC